MNEVAFRSLISGRQTGLAAGIARLGLRTLSIPYSWATSIRNLAFNAGIRKQHSVSVPVISVGNLTTGGTGKTPVVAWIVNSLVDDGQKPTIISRGYRSIDGEANDEKLVLEQLCPNVPHIQNPDRVAAAEEAIRNGATSLVLDDGFQHRRIARNLNIVLIDATCPFGYGHQLPRGLLRESIQSLNRADVVIVTRTDQANEQQLTTIRTVVAKANSGIPLFETRFAPTRLINHSGLRRDLEVNGNSSAFCAIGNPEGFAQTLQAIGVQLKWFESFPDHHHYDSNDISRLTELVNQHRIDVLLTTQKDLVKLKCDRIERAELWAVEIEAQFSAEQQSFEQLIGQTVHPG